MKVSGVQCSKCGEKIWSKTRHDFQACSCGETMIDGGQKESGYTRVLWSEGPVPEKFEFEADDETFNRR